MNYDSKDFKVSQSAISTRLSETLHESEEDEGVNLIESPDEDCDVDDLDKQKSSTDKQESDESHFGDDEDNSFQIKCNVIDIKSITKDLNHGNQDNNIPENTHDDGSYGNQNGQAISSKDGKVKSTKTVNKQVSKTVRFHSAPPRIHKLSYDKMDTAQYDRNKHKAFLRLLSLSLGRTVISSKK